MMTKDDEVADKRFAAVNDDPRFKRLKKKASKVRVDERFKERLYNDPEFGGVKGKMDKFGRKNKKEEKEKEHLKRFYDLSSSESADDDAVVDVHSTEDSQSEPSDMSEQSEEHLMDEVMKAHPLVAKDVLLGGPTRRLALVNMDWDQVKALDVFCFVSAFCPPGAAPPAVIIVPSEFGKERLAAEAISGPPKAIFKGEDAVDEDVTINMEKTRKSIEVEEEGDFDEKQLRKYQLERLKYYYAVIECDSVATAQSIYSACDSSEFEQSGCIIDLRYIPDSLEIDDVNAVDRATLTDKKKAGYRGRTDIKCGALQDSNVKLTWDADDPDRARVTRLNLLSKEQRKKVDLRDVDLAAYLASASSDDDNDNDDNDDDGHVEEYRKKLLGSSNVNVFGRKSADHKDRLDVSFSTAFDDHPFANVHNEATFDMKEGPDVSDDNNEETIFEKEMRRKRERKAERKAKRRAERKARDAGLANAAASTAQLSALLQDFNSDSDSDHASHKKQSKSTRSAKKDGMATDSTVQVLDPRFTAIYNQPEYAIDPSAPNFKRTTGMQALLDERARRRQQ